MEPPQLESKTSYTSFLFVALGIYKQIQAQETAVLHEAEEDNFDGAIYSLRPGVSHLPTIGIFRLIFLLVIQECGC